ncbi:MAG: prepilin-type N-terminal cleavage/methylation domain-containing protein [Gemmataceae bacterium]
MLTTAARRARPGFTLVELLVAAAVCVLIMAVMATAFSLGIDTVRT